jgi:hypothetical protein
MWFFATRHQLAAVTGRPFSHAARRLDLSKIKRMLIEHREFAAVVEAASREMLIGLVLFDPVFDSQRNHLYIQLRLGPPI